MNVPKQQQWVSVRHIVSSGLLNKATLSRYRSLQWMFQSSVLSSTPDATGPSKRGSLPCRAAARAKGPVATPEHSQAVPSTARVNSCGHSQTQEARGRGRDSHSLDTSQQLLGRSFGPLAYRIPTTAAGKIKRSPVIEALEFHSLITSNGC